MQHPRSLGRMERSTCTDVMWSRSGDVFRRLGEVDTRRDLSHRLIIDLSHLAAYWSVGEPPRISGETMEMHSERYLLGEKLDRRTQHDTSPVSVVSKEGRFYPLHVEQKHIYLYVFVFILRRDLEGRERCQDSFVLNSLERYYNNNKNQLVHLSVSAVGRGNGEQRTRDQQVDTYHIPETKAALAAVHLEEIKQISFLCGRRSDDVILGSSGMESARRTMMRRSSSSKALLHDLLHKGDTPVLGRFGRDPKTIQSIASLIRGNSQLLLLERPDTVAVYELNKPLVRSNGAGADQLYLPRIPRKPSNLTSMRASLSHSCPYLYDKRRGSVSSVGSQKTGDRHKKQSNIKELAEAKKSNVTVTMTYLGQRQAAARSGSGSLQDELKVLQQVNGGENICVFKGMVTPGEQFQFMSQRHKGYPFSATMYVNGLMAARISSCCEYRYSPGFQQGRRGCFRLAWLSGGLPCHRCTSLRNKYGSCQQLNNGTKENLIPPLDRNAGKDPTERCPSSPLFIPGKPEEEKKKKKKTPTSRQRTRKHSKEVSCQSTDSEEEDPARVAAKDSSKPKRRKGLSSRREDKGKTGDTGDSGEEEKKKRGNKVDRKKVSKGTGDYQDSKTSTHKPVQTDEESPGKVRTPRTEERAAVSGECLSNSLYPSLMHAASCSAAVRERERTWQETRPSASAVFFLILFNGTHWTDVSFLLRFFFLSLPLQVSLRDEEALTKQKGEEEKRGPGTNEKSRDGDYYEKCLDMSAALERGPNKQKWFKANILERCRLQKRLALGPPGTGSDLEPSEESDEPLEEPEVEEPPAEPEVEEPPAEPEVDEPPEEPELDAMMAVLNTSDEVDQLVLRNTDLTDDLLFNLVGALKSSPSEVTLLNLNLNLIGPYGAHVLLDLLRAKPQVKGLHLFGNKLRDHGIQILVSGIVELQEQTARDAADQQAMLLQSEQPLNPELLASLGATWGTLRIFTLLELDVGGNGLASDGLKLLAAYMRHYSFLQYLGLAQTGGADLAAWKELFDSLKENSSLTHIILDESNLGDPGVRMLADVLKVNVGLRQVDLDGNDISDVGGNDLMGALLCRTQFPLRHLSLQENNISAGLMRRIQEEVKNT
ncbi:Glutamate-rich protein 3 [Merluccius polli]|uniref:Glutamate-rich protein 3 n=1 Tax=Merluccius polli TaxID=89951 RepID=A0AA47N3L6_MERPO|nr:Glutamate-rich protein 3 [Merluccius polli]